MNLGFFLAIIMRKGNQLYSWMGIPLQELELEAPESKTWTLHSALLQPRRRKIDFGQKMIV